MLTKCSFEMDVAGVYWSLVGQQKKKTLLFSPSQRSQVFAFSENFWCKGMDWVADLRQKFETLCLEVDGVIQEVLHLSSPSFSRWKLLSFFLEFMQLFILSCRHVFLVYEKS